MRTFIAFIFLFFIFVDYANASDSTVRCPDIENMHQSANEIVDAGLINGSYIATTNAFAIHTTDMGWFAVVYNIDASSTNDAIEKARLIMRSISRQKSEFAESHAGIYVCVYDHGKIDVINNEEDWWRTQTLRKLRF